MDKSDLLGLLAIGGTIVLVILAILWFGDGG